MIYVEFLKRIHQVVPARLAVPVVRKSYCKWLHAINLGENMYLKSGIFTAADRKNAIVIISRFSFGIFNNVSQRLFSLPPVDVDFLFLRLTCLADTHVIKGDTFLSFWDATSHAILQIRERSVHLFAKIVKFMDGIRLICRDE